jgi:hypothetical protein
MRFNLVIMVLFACLMAGCTTPLLMVPSSSPVDGRAFEVLGPTEGESCYENILGIPLSRDASLHTAVKEAKLKVNAEALVDVVVDTWSLYTFFFNKQCTIVHANGIRFTGQKTPYLEPEPAVPPVPPKKEEAAPPPPPKEEAKAKIPAKPAEKKKSKRELARERRKAERERKKAEREAKRQAALEKKRQAEEEKKRQAEIAKKTAIEKRRAEEEAKPVPGQYKVFCKYKKGEFIRVETKTQVIEAEFMRCMYFGIRVKQKDKGIGVIPFEQIWMVKKIVAPKPEAEPAKPADPKKPVAPKTPAKPAKP